MHFEFLVESQAENIFLSNILKHIIGEYKKPNTWRIIRHKNKGVLPENLNAKPNKCDQSLLHNLPTKLMSYGNVSSDSCIIVILDQDNDDCKDLKKKLLDVLDNCKQRPKCFFRIAVEETESWILGDKCAIKKAYPEANLSLLKDYTQDSICNAWQLLGNIVDSKRFNETIKEYGKRNTRICQLKLEYIKKIAPFMDVNRNESPSFNCFKDILIKNI